jgi:GNAT superfamily N-acetyltransferase
MTLATATGARAAVRPDGLSIRDFDYSDADYAAAVVVGNLVYDEYPDTVDDWKHSDAKRPAHLKHRRWLALIGDEVVAYGGYSQNEGMYNPRLFHVEAAVRPDRQGLGVGGALYATILEALAPFDPLRVRSRTREDKAQAVRFLTARGFAEDMRDWESRLDVDGFDQAPYAGHEAKVVAGGITIATLADLTARDPEHRRKLYELDLLLSKDVPHPEPHTDFSYETFEHFIFNSPNALPEGFFVALDGDQYVGMSNLWKSQADPSELYTGLTGVRRDYRRRGIALALKLRAIEYARRHGVKTLKTWNESNNRPMLSINEALGFIKQPAWVSFVKHLKQE